MVAVFTWQARLDSLVRKAAVFVLMMASMELMRYAVNLLPTCHPARIFALGLMEQKRHTLLNALRPF